MEFDFLKKLIWAVVITVCAGWYISQHYTFEQVLKYSHEHPNESYSPAIDYYTGMGYYLRDQHESSIAAFQQLLADYPTCQYAPLAMLRLGSSFMEKYRYAEAREVFEKFIEQYPNDPNKKAVEDKYEYIKFK